MKSTNKAQMKTISSNTGSKHKNMNMAALHNITQSSTYINNRAKILKSLNSGLNPGDITGAVLLKFNSDMEK